MSDIRIFKRCERKYLLTAEQFRNLKEKLGTALIPDEYFSCMVQNIYYDTPNYRLIRESVDKPVYKEKLRLRCYNRVTPESDAYLEIKKKYNGIVYKRREKMNVVRAQEFLANPPDKPDSQIARELAWFVRYYGNLVPAMYLSYKRLSYVLENDRNVRLTFDFDIQWRTDNITFFDTPDGKRLFTDGQVLMEVKTCTSLPLSFVRILEELQIYPVSFSKYGMAYKTFYLK
ncbi:MAG: VTC domain-containing protein [Lachnospiraceae bacterium]